MQKQVAVLSVVTLALLIVLSVVGYFYVDGKLNPSKQLAVQTNMTKSKNTQLPPQESVGLQVQGAQSTPSQEKSQRLPTPSEFSVYEQYASAQNTQYVDIVSGSGQEAVAGSTAAVVYSGYLTNGQLFDQSPINEDGLIEPFGFEIGAGSVIRGWEEGIVGMKVGGQRRLVIPAELGYGATGAGEGTIPPNSMLIFDVELVEVQNNN